MNVVRSILGILYISVDSLAFQMRPKKLSTSKIMAAAPTPSDMRDTVTVLGFGSLLSQRSCKTTFPDLENFRLGRVPKYRRVFSHPASIFFQRGIANLKTLEISSLSAEYAGEDSSFICSVFEVPSKDMMENGIPSEAFLEREEEFDIVTVPYVELQDGSTREGILCTASTDDKYLKKWGQERFEKDYVQYGVQTVWGWQRDSGLKPCPVYLRHCVLAAKSMGQECYDSFVDDTYLVDRKTPLRTYLEQNPQIMLTEPPPELAERYGG
jgi:hypothetical protein